ncbi:TetR family transcriptional regulator C-terminal domain-containing protein [Kitasatospora sp. NPDC059571]|uniref:TetR family transcriptional regulator C-terminal domain-containing protein n=1 Tax=Kitasatospora sp. NPDC059571 TaxID=3346871 RepID=UPI003688B736
MARPSKREQLIDAAYDHFHEHGFNGSGVKDITDAAGVPKGTFYNHFESKEALAVEVMRRYAAAQCTEMLADESMAPFERVRAHFAHLAAGLARFDYARGCMLGNFGVELSTQSTAIREAVDESFNCWVSFLASALEEACATGSLASPVGGVRLARFLANSWEGAAARAKVTRSRGPVDDFAAVLESLAA